MVGFVIFTGATLLLCIANSTWNSYRVLEYFERPETKFPRKLLSRHKQRHVKEVYYLRFDTMLLLQSVMSDLKFSHNKKDEIEVYTVDSLKVVGHGCLSTTFSGILGIPYFLEWNSVDEVDLTQIRHQCSYQFGNYFTDHTLKLEALNLDEMELSNLKETFVLSVKAKKFALAKELMEIDRISTWFFYIVAPLVSCFALNQMAVHFNDIFKMLERPSIVRYEVLILVG